MRERVFPLYGVPIDDVARGLAEKMKYVRDEQDLEKTGRKLSPPPVVGQGSKAWHCWIAASASYQEAIAGLRTPRAYMIKKFATTASGGLTPTVEPDGSRPTGLKLSGRAEALMKHLGLDYEVGTGAQVLDLWRLQLRMNESGYLLLFYNLEPKGPAHTVVVYGVKFRKTLSGDSKLLVMDPSGSGELTEKSLQELQKNDGVILAWSAVKW